MSTPRSRGGGFFLFMIAAGFVWWLSKNPEALNTATTTAADAAPTSKAPIPPTYLALYHQATSKCPGLDWSVLAGIGKIETDHGRSPLPGVTSGHNGAGAKGPMQFLQGTFDEVRGWDSSIGADIYDPANAIPAAADLLCHNGAPANLYSAIFSYNHADWYVKEVLNQAHEYSTTGGT